ncbi:carbamate kinase [Candidatus Falkowbacteria bacterium RIFOXYC2_FULL_46_15]|uniref:Carbamate kinase n=1 Tax=Candidatus Falkowbacteria bacterium RIFOXYA2_FULL_47_19 TaxID=1797994 RepID=A0A1F5SL44_9BACT|nr:MAG: carbamate kinase [Candidatus Falkowbacteria bacterium RIFOXYA2_FULL_47_19]OGF36890.1 MAG: carbamate kinase [Candidatus Falkowbacteria bacterium RIFOXYC2_FULL_46_15]
MKKTAVVALGGNALLTHDEEGNIEQQEKNAYRTCLGLTKLLKTHNLIITHGNGPQVGNILLRNHAGYNEFKIPPMPLDICVADSQGGIGYMIERQMTNVLAANDLKHRVVTIVSQVLVSLDDPAFRNPTKPIGPYYPEEEAKVFTAKNGWKFKEDPRGRGWRRVVASPLPVDIFNKDVVKKLSDSGYIVIAAGGGGIPVLRKGKKTIGVEAVIDKDLASALLAKTVKAEALYIITDVEKVYLNFNKPSQRAIDKISVKDLGAHYDAGEFPAGSMGPKIKAAINFIKSGGQKAVITDSPAHPGTLITK